MDMTDFERHLVVVEHGSRQEEAGDQMLQATVVPEGEAPPTKTTNLRLTDTGGAERFLQRYGNDVRYCYPLKRWFLFDGQRWAPDNMGAIFRLAKRVGDILVEEAEVAEDPKAKWALLKFAESRCQSIAGHRAFIALAQSEVPVLSNDMDQDPFLLTVLNGTINLLQTGELRPHNRNDMISKLAPVRYDPQAWCPLWKLFLDRIFDGNSPLIEYLQRVVGYSLTGDTREKGLFILHGNGDNGKTTFLNAIQSLLGINEYATSTSPATFLATKYARIPNDVAALRGARFVAAVEVDSGQHLAEALIKQLTGGDIISSRFMRSEFFNQKPAFKIFIACNHRPEIRGRDDGIWGRINLIPFEVQIPGAQQDRQLGDKLKSELPGILNWALEGCLRWQREGLTPPKEVVQATNRYRRKMDPLGGFIDAWCLVGPGYEVMASRLYQAYCSFKGDQEVTQKKFSMLLAERGFAKRHVTEGTRWLGIRLKP